MPADIDALQATVARMEARLAALDDDLARELLAAYHALAPVLAADLDDPRDVLLSQGAALMLIQQALLERGRA
jgi:hypothetical protein